MRNSIITLAITIFLLAAELCNVAYACTGFTDVPDGFWAEGEIAEVSKLGFMTGTEPEVFEPETILTRAQIIQILWRVDGCPESDLQAGFRDVDSNAWYFEALCWGYQHGISLGFEYLLRPDVPITREELATILYRHSEEEYKVPGRVEIPQEVSAWATIPFEWAAASNIMAPTDPQSFVSRADMAVVLCDYWRFLNERESRL